MTTEEFIQKAQTVHGNRYDYSKVEYVNKKTKVCIVCSKHGEFTQSPQKHLSGQGCIKCHHTSLSKRFNLGRERFIEKAMAVHNGFYDYSAVEYINSHTHVQITCPIHGAFPQDPASHLKGHGCPICAGIENGKRKRKWTYEKCQEEAKKYKTKSEFAKKSGGAYFLARKNGWLNDYTWLKTPEIKRKWNRKTCRNEAKKYDSRSEFAKNSRVAYQVARKNGWLEDYTWFN